MALREHELDLKDRVVEIDERLSEIEEEKEDIERLAQQEIDEDELENPPGDLEDEWADLDDEEIELRGERWKFIETVVTWSAETDVVGKEPEDCSDDERSVFEMEDEEIESIFGDVGECLFRVRELTFGQLQRVSDDMMEESFEVDVQRESVEGTPRQGFYQTELLREATIDWPAGAPTRMSEYRNEQPDPGDYPIPVGDWLFDKVDALNTTGDTEMGNSSLKEALKSKR